MRIAPQALAVACLATALQAAAEPRQVDQIIAIVNDDVVLASEVMERFDTVMRQLQTSGQGRLPPQSAILEQILERLIVESIQLQEAESRGILVDDETLTRAVGDYAAENGMSIDQFIDALTEEGLSYRGFRDQVRRQLSIDRVQREVVNRRVYITEQDIEELLASPFFAEQLSDEYRVGHIMLALAPGASPAAVDGMRKQAEELARSLQGGADFAAAAMEHSAAGTALEGGDLGWRRASRLPGLFAEQIMQLQVGEVAAPMQNAAGFHIVKLLDMRGASQQRASETLVRHILVSPSTILSDAEALARAESIRERAIAGEDFAALAREFSDDPGSALAGGDLGWSTGEAFVTEFRDAVDATAIDEFAPVFRSEFGWHVLQVQGRREQDASEEARRDYATRVLHARRFDERLQEWLREIRDEAYVDHRVELTARDDADGEEGETN